MLATASHAAPIDPTGSSHALSVRASLANSDSNAARRAAMRECISAAVVRTVLVLEEPWKGSVPLEVPFGVSAGGGALAAASAASAAVSMASVRAAACACACAMRRSAPGPNPNANGGRQVPSSFVSVSVSTLVPMPPPSKAVTTHEPDGVCASVSAGCSCDVTDIFMPAEFTTGSALC